MEDLRISSNDIIFYEVEMYEDNPLANQEEEVQKEVNQANDDFMANEVIPYICTRVKACDCCKTKPTPILTQALLDNYTFSLVVISHNGRYLSVGAVISKCKRCDRINVWGDINLISRIYAEGFNDYMEDTYELTAEDAEVDEDFFGDPDNILTNIDEDKIIDIEEVKPKDEK